MALFETPTAAKIERLIRSWRLDNPAFLWAPTRPSNFLLDQQRRVHGYRSGRIDIGYGGVKVPVPNGAAALRFPTNLSIPFNGDFFCMLLVWIKDPAAVTGCFLKIGDLSGGVGVGGGATTFEDAGNKLIILRESIAWTADTAASFVPGLNVLSFYRTSESVLGVVNLANGAGVDSVSSNYNAPEAFLNINGYTASRGSNATVCAVAIWPNSYTNAQTVARRSEFAAPLVGLAGRHYLPLFTPEQILVPVSAGGGAQSADTAESATAADSAAASLLTASSQAESGTSSELTAAANATASSAAESATASESVDAELSVVAAAVESVAVEEAASASLSTAAAAPESGSAAEAPSASLETSSAQSESASASESQDGAVTSASDAICAESVTASDASSASLDTTASIAETDAQATDSASAFAAFMAAVLESVEATDAQNGSVSEAGSGAGAAEIWAYVLSNGLSAGATLVEVHALLLELHQIHGLESGSPLTVTTTSRTAAAISQTIAEVAGTVTVTRD